VHRPDFFDSLEPIETRARAGRLGGFTRDERGAFGIAVRGKLRTEIQFYFLELSLRHDSANGARTRRL